LRARGRAECQDGQCGCYWSQKETGMHGRRGP
jgi:hypothetical protein